MKKMLSHKKIGAPCTDRALAAFLDEEISEDLTSLPGVNQCTARILNMNGIENVYQLMGVFLTLKNNNETTQEHADAMWYWLNDIFEEDDSEHIDKHWKSHLITALIEKMEIMIPELYA